MTTLYVTIGNSDNKLKQHEWALFCSAVAKLAEAVSDKIHGVWYSTPGSPFQNMCVCFETNSNGVMDVRFALRHMAQTFGQDSIALAQVSDVELVKP